MIKELALSVGFDACGIAKADFLKEDAAFMSTWLEHGMHGDMSYLARNFEKRVDPRVLVPGCKSVVVLLLNYHPQTFQEPSAPQIAKYAYSQLDYHLVIKNKLNLLKKKIVELYGDSAVNPDFQHGFVDTAPVLERRWAERAGLGWIGKHTQLINPTYGSSVFIGVLLLNLVLPYDEPIKPKCGSCTKCIDSCPTKALDGIGGIDARRCISYLTIENKDEIPPEFHGQFEGCVLGCDICADVCPWTKKLAKAHTHDELLPINEVLRWSQQRWNEFSPEDFKVFFGESASNRAGFKKIKANISFYKPKVK